MRKTEQPLLLTVHWFWERKMTQDESAPVALGKLIWFGFASRFEFPSHDAGLTKLALQLECAPNCAERWSPREENKNRVQQPYG
jgi:hypothetical protein